MYIILRLRDHVPCELTDAKSTIGSNSVMIGSWATNTKSSSHPTSASLCILGYSASLSSMSHADDLEIRMFYHTFTFFWCLFTPFTCSQLSFTWLDRNVLQTAWPACDRIVHLRKNNCCPQSHQSRPKPVSIVEHGCPQNLGCCQRTLPCEVLYQPRSSFLLVGLIMAP
ncbi:hypothetical protein CI102_6227 [Trichoderma harzianum]|nr:hypothetical protein CI102_6227 [Trichoderma harzianum]